MAYKFKIVGIPRACSRGISAHGKTWTPRPFKNIIFYLTMKNSYTELFMHM